MTDPLENGHEHDRPQNSTVSPTIFDLLSPHIAVDALYNSRKREEEHASTCLPETRTKIIQTIRQWVDDGEGYAVCWLHGPPGTGKSTIAHTIAEEYSRKGLAATFFFARKKGDREDANRLIPTLVYQIAQNIPSTQPIIREALAKDGMILRKTLHDQFSALVIGPITNVKRVKRPLVVLDGLDECASRHSILKLIRLLGETIKTTRHPFRILLASRPEPDIEAAFWSHITRKTALWLALEDSKEDVQKYIREHQLKAREIFSSAMKSEPIGLWSGESEKRRAKILKECEDIADNDVETDKDEARVQDRFTTQDTIETATQESTKKPKRVGIQARVRSAGEIENSEDEVDEVIDGDVDDVDENERDELNEDEGEEDGDGDSVESEVVEARSAKRKRADSAPITEEEALLLVQGSCDRCIRYNVPCSVKPTEKRCSKCKLAKQACTWKGVNCHLKVKRAKVMGKETAEVALPKPTRSRLVVEIPAPRRVAVQPVASTSKVRLQINAEVKAAMEADLAIAKYRARMYNAQVAAILDQLREYD